MAKTKYGGTVRPTNAKRKRVPGGGSMEQLQQNYEKQTATV